MLLDEKEKNKTVELSVERNFRVEQSQDTIELIVCHSLVQLGFCVHLRKAGFCIDSQQILRPL